MWGNKQPAKIDHAAVGLHLLCSKNAYYILWHYSNFVPIVLDFMHCTINYATDNKGEYIL